MPYTADAAVGLRWQFGRRGWDAQCRIEAVEADEASLVEANSLKELCRLWCFGWARGGREVWLGEQVKQQAKCGRLGGEERQGPRKAQVGFLAVACSSLSGLSAKTWQVTARSSVRLCTCFGEQAISSKACFVSARVTTSPSEAMCSCRITS